jgi:hypothetical protein
MNWASRISLLVRSLFSVLGIKALWLAIAAVAMFACASRADGSQFGWFRSGST